MLVILIPIIWLAVVTLFVAVCRCAAHGDDVLGRASQAAGEVNAAAQQPVPGQREGYAPSLSARWNRRGDTYPSVSPRLTYSRQVRPQRQAHAPRIVP
jgi:hypothetical protein